MFSVIKTGGKQYIISPGQKIKIEKLPNKEGEEVVFDEVLLLENDKEEVRLGAPFIAGIQVKGKILKQGKRKKLFGVKFKPKKREKKTFGHRQQYTEVE